MISYLKGKVVLFRSGFLILETGGVGYKVVVDPQIKIKQDVVDTGQTVELFIHEQIKEDTDDLYGFLTFEELELFEKLISVNGIGPKAGIAVMGSGSADQIKNAIVAENITYFKAVPGIGTKVAAKIILELKSKISTQSSSNVLDSMNQGDELYAALISLGYIQQEIGTMISKMPKELETIEEKIKWVLKNKK